MSRCVIFIMFISVFLCAMQAQSDIVPKIIAHRGGAGEGFENTLSCVGRSIAAGVAAVEVDVRLTADGHVVVCHDATVNATTNGKGRIAKMLLTEVQALRIVDENGIPTDEAVPTLKELLQFVGGRCEVLIDVKRSGRGIEKQIVEDVLACDATEWVAVQSFSDAVLRRLHELGAPFPLEKLVVFKVPVLPFVFDGTLRFFSFKKYSYISSFNVHKRCLSRSFAAKIGNNGKCVKVWTLCSPCDAPRVAVDAVITDNPSLWLGKKQ